MTVNGNIKIYGIKNCDTVRKALKWLDHHQKEYYFFDLKKTTLSQLLIDEWLTHVDKNKLINQRGSTWRKLTEEEKTLNTRKTVIQLIQNNPTLLKRPVHFNGKAWSVGFDSTEWEDRFQQESTGPTY